MENIASNKKARHDYFILDTYEAGIILKGSEIKSVRARKVVLGDSYVIIKNAEAFILNMHIAKYDFANIFNHEETRTRKLLLNKKEILKLSSKLKDNGLSIVPLSMYIKDGLAKLEIALVKGKKDYDKRQTIKERDQDKRLKKVLGRNL